METDVAALNTFLSDPYLDIRRPRWASASISTQINMNSHPRGIYGMGAGDHEASLAERMNTQFGGEAADYPRVPLQGRRSLPGTATRLTQA